MFLTPLFASLAVAASPVHVLAFNMPRGYEWIVILAIALLLFGKRLPGVAKGIGQGIWEFKKGLKTGSDADEAGETDDAPRLAEDDRAPRYDPQTGKPLSRESVNA